MQVLKDEMADLKAKHKLELSNMQDRYENNVKILQNKVNELTLQLPISGEEKTPLGVISMSEYVVNSSELEYSKADVIGTGAFGKVYQGNYYKQPVAIKKIKGLHVEEGAVQAFIQEIKTLMYKNCDFSCDLLGL
jgi:hypothetical protein